MSGLRLPGAIDPIAIALAGTDAREIAMPDVGRTSRSGTHCSFCPASSNRQSSTRVACWLKSEKFVPMPSHVAPSGNRDPGRTRSPVATLSHAIASVIVHWCGYTVPRAPRAHIPCQVSGAFERLQAGIFLPNGTGRAFVRHGRNSFPEYRGTEREYFHYAIDDTARAIRP